MYPYSHCIAYFYFQFASLYNKVSWISFLQLFFFLTIHQTLMLSYLAFYYLMLLVRNFTHHCFMPN